MIRSMTGFASQPGALAPHSWIWELRSVNGKGLDLRMRLPDWVEGLEPAMRKAFASVAQRGNVTLSLRITREVQGGTMKINPTQLDHVLGALKQIETKARESDLTLTPVSSAQILSLRGVFEESAEDDDIAALKAVLLKDVAELIAAFNNMREAEGHALEQLLLQQLDEVETLVGQAALQAEARKAETADTLRSNLARVLDNADGVDADRVAQELALLAVKSDVTEEIDRLRTHINAARDLIQTGGAVGRKLDFLMQEFNREANTLCSKSQNAALTRTGLELKARIDQMREQVQNVE